MDLQLRTGHTREQFYFLSTMLVFLCVLYTRLSSGFLVPAKHSSGEIVESVILFVLTHRFLPPFSHDDLSVFTKTEPLPSLTTDMIMFFFQERKKWLQGYHFTIYPSVYFFFLFQPYYFVPRENWCVSISSPEKVDIYCISINL